MVLHLILDPTSRCRLPFMTPVACRHPPSVVKERSVHRNANRYHNGAIYERLFRSRAWVRAWLGSVCETLSFDEG